MIDGCFWALQQMISCYDLQTQPIILLLAIEGTIWGSSLEPTYSFGFKMLNGSCWKKDSSDSSSFTLHPLSDQKLQNTTYLQFLFCGLQHNLLQTGGLLFIWRNTWTKSSEYEYKWVLYWNSPNIVLARQFFKKPHSHSHAILVNEHMFYDTQDNI